MGEEQTNGTSPRHIAIIMDGNGRWAKQRGLPRIDGHRAGAASGRKIIEECARLGVRYLTLYSFSTENWRRPVDEVSGLMELFYHQLTEELPTLVKNNIRLRAIGDLSRLPLHVRVALNHALERTKNNDRLDLVLAVSYGSRHEITEAVRSIACRVAEGTLQPEQIDQDLFSRSLWTADIPDPDILVRTSGEERISNFLLWQLAYTELFFVPEYWPDFDEQVLHRVIDEYARRERRYGLTAAPAQPATTESAPVCAP